MTKSSPIEQSSSHEQIVKDLYAACAANDFAHVRDLFNTKLLSAADATSALKDAVEYEPTPPDPPLIHFLVEQGADPNALRIPTISSFDTLKLLADLGYDIKSQGHLILKDVVDSRENLDWLLDRGVNINRTGCEHLTNGRAKNSEFYESSLKVLNAVAARGDIELFDHLVSRGAKPSLSIALHSVSECKDPQKSVAMISHLVDKYCMDLNADSRVFNNFFHDDESTGTPLNSAVYHGNLPVVQELLRRGASPTSLNSNIFPADRAVGRARTDGYLPALRPLLEAGGNSTEILHYAVHQGKVEAARICLECGANPVKDLDREQARINKVKAGEYVSSEERVMSDEMRNLLEDWKPVSENVRLFDGLNISGHDSREGSQ